MSFDYVESAQDALALLQDFDALPCTVLDMAGPPAVDDYDPATGTGGPAAPTSVTALGVILDYTAKEYGNQPDALIRYGDRQVLMAAIDVNGAAMTVDQVPMEAQILAPDGVTYTIKNIKPLNPTGVVVLFDINVRR